ncbi:MAG TPA: UpxY family transcription antiterminator [Puia sp.]|nr:UpxY family transcription antiterminator [Puia sp.]
MSASRKNWYVVYTKPRWEKKVYTLLTDKNIEAYCPLNKVRRKWSDRIKWVEEPLFKSYVFVKVAAEDLSGVRMINGVVNFVYWLGKPAIVKHKEIEIIRKFLNDYEEVWTEPIELQKDARVVIRRGAFMDKEARVVKVTHNNVRVLIESIGYSLVAVVARSNVDVVGKR